MEIGKEKISIIMPHLKEIALEFGLRLNRLKEFKIARSILAIRYKSI